MRTLPLVYSPGDSCKYSSGDLIVLGAVIEKISGMNFQDYHSLRLHSSCDMLTPMQAHKKEGELKKHWKNYYKKRR